MANACLGEDAECFDCSQFRYTQPGLDLFTKEDQASAIFFPAARALVSILILDGIPCARSKSWLICQGKGYSDCTADAGCSWSGSTSPGGARFCNTRTANVELDAQQKQSLDYGISCSRQWHCTQRGRLSKPYCSARLQHYHEKTIMSRICSELWKPVREECCEGLECKGWVWAWNLSGGVYLRQYILSYGGKK